MIKVGKWIAKHKILIIIIGIALLIPAYLGMAATRINYDVLSYLPDTLETVEGQDIMVDQFGMGAFSMIVVEDMELKDVAALKEKIEAVDHVKKVLWYDSIMDVSVPVEMLPKDLREAFFNGDATMMIALFDNTTSSETSMEAVTQIRKITSKNCFVSGMTGIVTDIKQIALKEMPIYVVIASCLSLVVLLLAMDSLVVPVLFLLCIGVAVLYNLGSNIFLGQISYITQALTAVLQLGVTMDYSIFLLNSYEENKKRFEGDKERAMAHAINATFKSVIGSSITTVAGFIALCFMSFTLGRDLGIVMAKGVALGVISTLTILPALIMYFDKIIEKRRHPVITPHMHKVAAVVTKHPKRIIMIFVVIALVFFRAQGLTSVYYTLTDSLPQDLTGIAGTNKLDEDFGMPSFHFVIINDNMSSAQKKSLADELDSVEGIKSTLCYEKFVGGGIPESAVPDSAAELFRSNGHELMMITTEYKPGTDEMNTQVQRMNKIIKRYDADGILTGEGAMTKDLITTSAHDFNSTSVFSILAVFLIIVITFKSISIPFLLVLSIEGAIMVNLGIPYFTGSVIPFIASIVLGTIQLGATVDYAILMTTRFHEERLNGLSPHDAAATAIETCAPSIITSGLSFFAATIGLYFVSRIDLIRGLCLLISRGAIISMLVILFVLPAILILFAPIIRKTTYHWLDDSKESVDIEVQEKS